MSGKIIGIGAPVLDHLIEVSEEELTKVSKTKGGMTLIPLEILDKRKRLYSPVNALGGSALNTIKSLAHLGHNTAFIGKYGYNKTGYILEQSFQKQKIENLGSPGKLPNAESFCFITPDGERTMQTYLGACSELTVKDLEQKKFKGASIVHIEGYSQLIPDITLKAFQAAKIEKALISFNLASYEVVTLHQGQTMNFVNNFVDILFGNEQEIFSLTGRLADQSAFLLQQMVKVVVITQGPKGCTIGADGKSFHVPTTPLQPLDTTGAGDLFAAGFLDAYLQNKSLEECAKRGFVLANEVLNVLGTDLPENTWSRLKFSN